MSFTIQHGLFRANITDYHAILGVSLDAEPKKIRLKYLRIAQKLHPDTCKGNPKEKKLASQILSRLVNPAYQELCNKNQYIEHQLVLTQIGKRHAEKSDRMTIASEPAKKLLQAEKDIDLLYHKILRELTKNQYSDISKVIGKTAAISELNFVYLVLKQKQGINREEQVTKKQFSPAKNKSANQSNIFNSSVPTPPAAETQTVEEPPTPESQAASYIRRAKEYMAKGRINDTISELKDALKLDPNNSTAHGLMGQAYIRQNQLTMAKVHLNKAYKANPKDPVVIQGKEELEKVTKRQKNRSANITKNAGKNKKDDSGFFSGFFGSKKK